MTIRVDDIRANDMSRKICIKPCHCQRDHLGACVICGVPTIAGLHPNARTKLLLKRPDLAHLVAES
jgi:hypothetical protein